MSDIDVEVLSKYDIKINRTYKGRGCIICEGKDKCYKLLPYGVTSLRLLFEARLLDELRNGSRSRKIISTNGL